MSELRKIRCGAHGKTRATFTCRHVARGVACGFHAEPERSDDLWPDAWCDLCDAVLQAAGGEWTQDAEQNLEITPTCTYCYEAARERNRRVPELARGTRLIDARVAELVHVAVHEAQAGQDASNARTGWLAMARWDFDPGAGTLTFSDAQRATVIADVQLIGSFSLNTNTFQWAWATLAPGNRLAEAAVQLRTFGEVRGIERLTAASWAADEVDGWELVALARYLSVASACTGRRWITCSGSCC
jgi:hypothetical protein